MLDINNEFENILVNNGIIQRTTLNDAINVVKSFKENLTEKDTVGIYGLGIDADTLLHFITSVESDFCIDYCFDRKTKDYYFKKNIKNTKVLCIENIHQIDVDYMILGSYQYRGELKNTLKELNYKGTIIDFFQPMESYLKEHTSDYQTIYETKKRYQILHGKEMQDILRKLIKEYLLIKDFSSTFQYIDEYIENKFDDIETYQNLKRELTGLLDKIKNCVNSRKGNDIIINWIDALPYMHLQDFYFLQSKAEKAVSFKNMYTVNPWTTETMKTLLYGKYSIQDKLFLKDKFSTNDAELLKLLSTNGYVFSYLGMNKYAKLYDDKSIILPELNFHKDNSSISRQWDALNLLCKVEKPLCLLIHTLSETHEPYICGEIEPYQKFTCTEADWNQKECIIQAKISGQYIDKQFAFYDQFLGKQSIKIYMSDHGRITNSIMRESRVHTIFIVDYPDVEHEKIEGLTSLIDFSKLISICLSREKDFKQVEREYVFVEALDYYNFSWIQETLTNPKYNRYEGLQRRGIITLKDRYCRFVNDMEGYFKDDDKKNLINDIKYEARIEELRRLCSDEFIDINQYDKFKYSHMLYKV